ncbi:MAG: DUF134 domain-containing protein [Candidatus Aenigmarchaeota archaeon]|nr:DUF134 domain-containing protein [Candidatus Aenigmarchaeota archaeon]
MMTGCEVVVHYVFPTVRAMIAQQLIETHGLTQKEAARRMGLTQPAISQYKKHARGQQAAAVKKNDVLVAKINEIATALSKDELDAEHATARLCEICEEVRKGGVLENFDVDVKYALCAETH